MTEYKVISRDYPNELWASGFTGQEGRARAERMIAEGYWHRIMHQADRHKTLVVVTVGGEP